MNAQRKKEKHAHTHNESNRIEKCPHLGFGPKNKRNFFRFLSLVHLSSHIQDHARTSSQEISVLKEFLYMYIHLACECAFLNCSNTFKLGGSGFYSLKHFPTRFTCVNCSLSLSLSLAEHSYRIHKHKSIWLNHPRGVHDTRFFSSSRFVPFRLLWHGFSSVFFSLPGCS